MNCEHCNGKLRVTHTYSSGDTKYQRAVCEDCRTPHCLTTTAVVATKRGDGARARARARQHSTEDVTA